MTVFSCNANLAVPLVLPLYIFLVLEYSFIAFFVSSIAPIILCNHVLIYVLTDLLPNCRLYAGPDLCCVHHRILNPFYPTWHTLGI